MSDDLNARLLAAHAAGDRAALITLYEQAARAADADGEDEAAAFYMTHAYVFALEAGEDRAQALKAWLVERGRETER